MIDLNIFTYLIVALVILWLTTITTVEKKRIMLFLPFFIFGTFNCFRAAFVLFQFYSPIAFGVISLIFISILIWIFIIVWRENGRAK